MEPSTNGATAASAGTFQPIDPTISIDEAAIRLGVAPSTVRRWVKAGRFHAAQVLTKQGYTFRIPLAEVEAAAPSTVEPVTPSVEPSASDSIEGSNQSTVEPSAATSVERSIAMADYNAKLVQPWADQVERLTERLETLARENGELATELRLVRDEQAKRSMTEPARPWWAFWRH